MTAQISLPALLSPFVIKGITLRNRTVMPAMQRGHCIDGKPSAALAAYYSQRAAGGVALIIGESCAVDHPSATAQPTAGRMTLATRDAWRVCVDAVHAAGGRMLIQLWHEGAIRDATDGLTRSPSGLVDAKRGNGRAATLGELGEIRDAFIRSACHAAAIGADGVEIHACHGYFLDQCLWNDTNMRTDGYGGGDIRDRARLTAEIVRGIRAACGSGFLISFRFSQWKEVDYGAHIVSMPVELADLTLLLKDAGVDIFHVSTRRFWEPEWPDDPRGLAGWTRALSGLPVIAVGSVGLGNDVMSSLLEGEEGQSRVEEAVQELDRRLNASEFDLIAIGRGLIGDPDWVAKVAEGRHGDVRPFQRADLGDLGWDLGIVKDAHGL